MVVVVPFVSYFIEPEWKFGKPSTRDVGMLKRTMVVQLVKVDLGNAYFNETIMKFTIVHV